MTFRRLLRILALMAGIAVAYDRYLMPQMVRRGMSYHYILLVDVGESTPKDDLNSMYQTLFKSQSKPKEQSKSTKELMETLSNEPWTCFKLQKAEGSTLQNLQKISVITRLLDISVLDAHRLINGHPIWAKRQITRADKKQIQSSFTTKFSSQYELKITSKNYIDDQKKEMCAELAVQKPPLDKVKMEGALLQSAYFLDLLQYIKISAKSKDAESRRKQIQERREALKNKDEEMYRFMVKQLYDSQEATFKENMNQVLEALEIDFQTFIMTKASLMNHPQSQQLLMMAQSGQLNKNWLIAHASPKITKTDTLNYIQVLRTESKEKMASMSTRQHEMGLAAQLSGDPMTILVEQAKMSDETYQQTQIEQEDFECALMYFCQNDKEVKSEMQAYMMEMQWHQNAAMATPPQPLG